MRGGPGRPERRRRRPRRDRRQAIYLLPNLITTAALLFGFWSIVQAFHGRFDRAAFGIVLAAICDMLDGRVARATRSTSRFGVEYDSIADMVSFGLAPAVLVYAWMLVPLGPRGWLIAALFAICAALRLARFNVQQHIEQRDRYRGIPSTIAGSIVAATVWFVHWTGLAPPFPRPVGLALTVGFASLALLMVSSLPYLSMKSVPLGGRQGFRALVAFTLASIVVLLWHEPALFALGFLYALSGPALWLWELRYGSVALGSPDPGKEI